MKHTKKILALVLSIAVVASIAAAGTLAYLTGNAAVSNNFKVGTEGDVKISMDEAKVGDDGKAIIGDAAERVDFNEYKSMLPGQVMDKDPTVYVEAHSASSYVFAYIYNELGENVTLDINTSAWKAIGTVTENVPADVDDEGNVVYVTLNKDVYQYVGTKATDGVVAANTTDAKVDLEPIFEHVTVNPELKGGEMALLNDKNIMVGAFAIQSENLATADKTATQVATEKANEFFSNEFGTSIDE